MKVFVSFQDFGLQRQMQLLKLYRNLFIIFTLILMVVLFLVKPARAEEIVNVERLAAAIYKAEGGDKTSHPYGILAHYKHTTPRQACINSINNNYKRWIKAGMPEDFIVFMGRRYSPPAINPNWVKLVKYFYNKKINGHTES